MFRRFIKDVYYELCFIIDSSIHYFSRLILFLLPYAMLVTGVLLSNGDLYEIIKIYWWLLLVPIVISFITRYMKWYANKIGKGDECPVPVNGKRFTETDEEGMVTVDKERLPELLLYVADVEDFLEKKGIL